MMLGPVDIWRVHAASRAGRDGGTRCRCTSTGSIHMSVRRSDMWMPMRSIICGSDSTSSPCAASQDWAHRYTHPHPQSLIPSHV